VTEALDAVLVQLARIEAKVDAVAAEQSRHGEALASLGGETMHVHERMRDLADDVGTRVKRIDERLSRHISDTEPSPPLEHSSGNGAAS
jgi:hypothetical protein